MQIRAEMQIYIARISVREMLSVSRLTTEAVRRVVHCCCVENLLMQQQSIVLSRSRKMEEYDTSEHPLLNTSPEIIIETRNDSSFSKVSSSDTTVFPDRLCSWHSSETVPTKKRTGRLPTRFDGGSSVGYECQHLTAQNNMQSLDSRYV
jgi:hypothetical protein